MRYQLRYSSVAYQDVRRVPAHLRRTIRSTIDSLTREPRPPASKELRGFPGIFRVRADQWRIIDSVDDADAVVLIIRIKRKTGPETYANIHVEE